MQGDGVVDLRADFAGGEEVAELVAAGGANDVLVPDAAAAWNLVRQNQAALGIGAGLSQAGSGEEGVVFFGDFPAGLVPESVLVAADGLAAGRWERQGPLWVRRSS